MKRDIKTEMGCDIGKKLTKVLYNNMREEIIIVVHTTTHDVIIHVLIDRLGVSFQRCRCRVAHVHEIGMRESEQRR